MVRHTGEDFIDVEGVAVAAMLSLESAGARGTKFDTPQADRLTSDEDPAFRQEIFDILVTDYGAPAPLCRIFHARPPDFSPPASVAAYKCLIKQSLRVNRIDWLGYCFLLAQLPDWLCAVM